MSDPMAPPDQTVDVCPRCGLHLTYLTSICPACGSTLGVTGQPVGPPLDPSPTVGATARPDAGPGSLATTRQRAWGALLDAGVHLPVTLWAFLTRTTHIETTVLSDGRLRQAVRTDPRPPVVALLLLLPWAIYLIVSIGRWGRTVGERLVKIRVVALDGSAPGWSRAAIRWAVPGAVSVFGAVVPLSYVSLIASAIIYGMVYRTPLRQGLHDKLAGVIVVQDQRAAPV